MEKLVINCETQEETLVPLNASQVAEMKALVEANQASVVEPTVESKLQSVGLNLNDLKAALGL